MTRALLILACMIVIAGCAAVPAELVGAAVQCAFNPRNCN